MAKRPRQTQSQLPGMDGSSPDPVEPDSVKSDAVEAGVQITAAANSRAENAENENIVAELNLSAPLSSDLAPPPEDSAPGACPPGSSARGLAEADVWVIDAHALIFQVFHAIPEMTSPHGDPVNAVFGFTRDVLYLIEQKQPDYLFCAFDLSGPTFRHTLYSDYKLQRTEMPSDLRPQLPLIRRMLEALGVPILEVESYEADDILATVAARTEALGGNCIVVTNDKDARQLISARTRLFNVRKNQLFDTEALAADWGIRPDQVVDYQAIVGDSVDNVPGIPLFGPKLARELLTNYGTLDEIFEHADSIAGDKRRQNLLQGREQALLSRELTRLSADVPVALDWEAARVSQFQLARLLPLFLELGFHGFAAKVRGQEAPSAAPAWQADYRTVDSRAQLDEVLERLTQQTEIAIELETSDAPPTAATLVGLALSYKDGEVYHLPLAGPASESILDLPATLEALKPLLENPSIKKVGHNLKHHAILLRKHGVQLAGIDFDTMIASYLLDAGERNHTLDELTKRYLHHTIMSAADLLGTGKERRPIEEVSIAARTKRVGEAADAALRLRKVLEPKLEELQLTELLRDLEMPLIEVLATLELNGIKVQADRLAELSRRYGDHMAILEREIYALAGHEFNIASPKQLQTVLFTELRLPVLKKTKTGPSTDADVLEVLAAQHPLPRKIIEFRQYSKLKSTYVDALPALIHAQTGRVHACFNQVVAATGRLSASDPNLQNIVGNNLIIPQKASHLRLGP